MAISSRAEGGPWAPEGPPLFGGPKPVGVRQAIITGLSEVSADSIAATIAGGR